MSPVWLVWYQFNRAISPALHHMVRYHLINGSSGLLARVWQVTECVTDSAVVVTTDEKIAATVRNNQVFDIATGMRAE